MSAVLEVWLDCDFTSERRVGTLAHDRGQVRFHYDQEWLKQSFAFALDPDLSLGDEATLSSEVLHPDEKVPGC
ncbi:MAG: HipA N-terminal domain-containing protein [Burkholderiales bacterium]|jgi:serine/threonine-protein kinase HipA|nr:HipA N-terminal domain-containing protein [Burkholderiales bacterium]